MYPEAGQIWHDESGYRITITQMPYWMESPSSSIWANIWVVYQSNYNSYPIFHLMEADKFKEAHSFYAHNKWDYFKKKFKEFFDLK